MSTVELPRETAALLEVCKTQGWGVDKTSKGHWKVKAPSGKVTFTSGTPGDWRAHLNFRSDLKRMGLELPQDLAPQPQEVLPQPAPANGSISAAHTIEPTIAEQIFTPVPSTLKGMSMPKPGTQNQRILEAMASRGGGVTLVVKDIADLAKLDPRKTGIALAQLCGRGLVLRRGHGQYSLPKGNGVNLSAPAIKVRELKVTSRTGDKVVDADLKTLDQVLDVLHEFELNQKRMIEKVMSAFASLDHVVRGHLKKTQKLMELKRALSNIEDSD